MLEAHDAWRADPVLYAQQALGQDVDWWLPRSMAEVMSRSSARLAVKGCNSGGKTHMAACLVQWWVDCGLGRAVTTAPTAPQVHGLLWRQLARIRRGREGVVGGRLLVSSCRLEGAPGCYAYGRSTDQGVRFRGEHADEDAALLVVLDEANGIRDDVTAELDGIAAGGDVRILMLGNPDDASGSFHDAFAEDSDRWETLTVDAFSTPNFECWPTPDALRAADPAELDARSMRPYLAMPTWARQRYEERKWRDDDPWIQSRVRGRFPGRASGHLFSVETLDAAAARPAHDVGGAVRAGLDIAGEGRDETSYHVVCIGNGSILDSWHSPAKDAFFEATARLKSHWGGRLEEVVYDATGIGQLAWQTLEDAGFDLVQYHAGGSPELADPEDGRACVNAKAEMYQAFADRLDDGRVAGLEDRLTRAQLAGVRYHRDSRLRLVIDSKRIADPSRPSPSPDRGESLMMAYYRQGQRWTVLA